MIAINLPDKVLAGVHQSYTITSDEGPPSGTVSVGSQELSCRIIRLGAPKDLLESTTLVVKYKVTFLLPEDSVGKKLALQFQAGSSRTEKEEKVTES